MLTCATKGERPLLKKTLMLIVGCMIFAPVLGSAVDAPNKGPQVFLPESVFEFQPVVEGAQVEHEFVLYNQGDELLEIMKIKSG